MNILENKMEEKIEDVISIAERDGNTKRRYLLLNKLQAKYLPVKGKTALSMFDKLANEVKHYEGKLIVIGFAETATAIGARVAYQLALNPKNKVTFLTTTREKCDCKPIVEFQEEHSHAVEQILYGNEKVFQEADYIIFAEDEVTTGNTICNCVKKLNLKCKYVVASLLNCMSDEEIERFTSYDISPYYLIKTDKEGFDDIGENESINLPYENCEVNIKKKTVFGFPNPRLGVDILKYHKNCIAIANSIKNECSNNESILILGTEECMYPSIVIADELEKDNFSAVVQSTTRVPTCTNKNSEYPLHTRYQITSFYDDRDVYVYNLQKYDKVYIVSDGHRLSKSTIRALYENGCKDVKCFYLFG